MGHWAIIVQSTRQENIGLPKNSLVDIPKKYDAILFGALGDPRIPDMAHGREILLGLRFGLDLFVNLRPVKLLHDSLGILKNSQGMLLMNNAHQK